jgi:NAD/NADP transhydrogenase beta subunit
VKSMAFWQMVFIVVLAAASGWLLFGPVGAAGGLVVGLLINRYGARRPHVLR